MPSATPAGRPRQDPRATTPRARLRGRPDPGHVDAAKLLPIAYVVATAMLAMSVVLIIGDLVVPLRVLGS